jgi:hypothetical protein
LSQAIFNLVEEHSEELLRVLLLSGVSGVPLKVLEGKAKLVGVEIDSLGYLQVGEHFLDLVERVVIDLFALVLLQILSHAIVNRKQLVSEAGDVKELLEDGVHVANAAQVAQADKALSSLNLVWRHIIPLVLLLKLLR